MMLINLDSASSPASFSVEENVSFSSPCALEGNVHTLIISTASSWLADSSFQTSGARAVTLPAFVFVLFPRE